MVPWRPRTWPANGWSGKYRYGVSGSIVAYIDHKYGRDTILELLAVSSQAGLLAVLGVPEDALLEEWKGWLTKPGNN